MTQQPPPGWGPPPPQQPRQPRAGRIVLAVFAGALAGFIAPFLPPFLWAVLTGQNLNIPGLVLLGLLVVCVPGGALLGGLLAARRKPAR